MHYKGWVLVAVLVFGISIAVGMATPVGIADPIAEDLFEQLSGLLTPFSISTAMFIFAKNASAIMISFILSPILCLFPIMALTVNGWLLGFISSSVVSQESLGFLLAGLLPHGVLEIPALILGEAAALSFGVMTILLVVKRKSRTVLVSTVTKDTRHVLLALALFFIVGIFHTIIIVALLEKQTRELLMVNLRQNLRYLMVALALLVPAAIIETYITPLLLGL